MHLLTMHVCACVKRFIRRRDSRSYRQRLANLESCGQPARDPRESAMLHTESEGLRWKSPGFQSEARRTQSSAEAVGQLKFPLTQLFILFRIFQLIGYPLEEGNPLTQATQSDGFVCLFSK